MSKFDFYEFSNTLASITELLDHEAELLASQKVKEAAKLHDKKEELTIKLEGQKKLLGDDGNLYNTLSNQQVDRLREQTAQFNKSMQSYQHELFRASTVNEQIVQMIASTVQDQVRRQSTYGNFRMASKSRERHFAPAIKFSEKI